VDYSVCNGMNFNSGGLRESLLIYDVYCQYGVHFEERIESASGYLCKDPDMKIIGAIGKFHLADHVDSCFSKFSLNFLKGAGHIDGEIMETLWAGMNKVSAAARSMTKAHRQETLDDYMRDSNWKKTVGIGKLVPGNMIVVFNLVILSSHPAEETEKESNWFGFDTPCVSGVDQSMPASRASG
jgi:Kyakuja-Dileera-Zisupton transposase